ncbi:putative spermidine/putrescine transport system permease protein/spermidine/putrescine transport system permease protein [Roseovarius nanhaiticus]|uniref:Putative spermidine/putrescine transport system permease protein/spermidine/putrescine transport system permease protein n=1 Tax=Roseovarius nanhaiticus TaxID=573024 RepID=A0A1N7ENG7_9RHOB|nr:ABC transporter permease [Roseovarius nanhaiticus]SEK70988.1 putative spermidine/putrescine transport system permease protein/spermidine/putrescine transport system permease protein [Roseovarius nanhaiticus]SIR89455.1 putative spermidine/putrescine transport system permease protein/spermidine/putrescine transport system permease protein [Roseovarius nanhaiticus]
MAVTETPHDMHAAGLRRDERMERWKLFGLGSPALLLVMVILVIPVGWLFYVSFVGADGSFSLENYERMVSRKSYMRIFITTFQVSILTTALCILIGYPLAYFMSQLPAKWAGLCLVTVLLPFWTSLLVRTYAWLVLLQKQGLVNQWAINIGLWDEPLKFVHNMTGTLIGMVHIMLPFLILPVYGAMRAIDADYLKAASNLGASPKRAFWTVFFPLSTPGLFAGSLMVFVLCLGFFVTPAVLGGGRVIMVSMKIVSNIELFVNWGAASALGVVLLVMTGIILWIASRFLRLEQMAGGGH